MWGGRLVLGASLALAVGFAVPALVFLPTGVPSPPGWFLLRIPGAAGWFHPLVHTFDRVAEFALDQLHRGEDRAFRATGTERRRTRMHR